MTSAVPWTRALLCGAVTDQNQTRSFLPERTVFGRSFLPERTFAEMTNLCEVRRGKPESPARQAGPTSCGLHSGLRPGHRRESTAKGLAKTELIFALGNWACQSTETAVQSIVATVVAVMTNGTSMPYSRNSFAILPKQNDVVTRCKSMNRGTLSAFSSFLANVKLNEIVLPAARNRVAFPGFIAGQHIPGWRLFDGVSQKVSGTNGVVQANFAFWRT